MKIINIGIVGFGTVGAGVAEVIQKNSTNIADKSGIQLAVKTIVDLDVKSCRGVDVSGILLSTDFNSILNDDEIKIVIETIGGITFAKTVIEKALNAKKSVVTANKALISLHFQELSELAQKNGVDLYYEASVGGGIPCIKSLRESLIANNIENLYGILNGTCNYILTQMERTQRSFGEILPEAQAAGYAEKNPDLDIDGGDTLHKMLILTAIITGKIFLEKDIYCEGIRNISLIDMNIARKLGYRIKLLSIIKIHDDKISLCVQPTLVELGKTIGTVSDVYNALLIKANPVGDIILYGRGAGRAATASAVVGDIVDIAMNVYNNTCGRIPAFIPRENSIKLITKEKNTANFYFRIDCGNTEKFRAELGDNAIAKFKEELYGYVTSKNIDGYAVSFAENLSFSRVTELKNMFPNLVAIRCENI